MEEKGGCTNKEKSAHTDVSTASVIINRVLSMMRDDRGSTINQIDIIISIPNELFQNVL